MYGFSLLVLTFFAFAAFTRWTNGIYLAVLMALLQDPLRKLTPDQPPIFILFVGVVFGASILGAATARVPLLPTSIIGWRHFIHKPFSLYATIVVAQAVHSFLRFGNPMVPALGLISYLAPFVALVTAYAFVVMGGILRLEALLKFYLICALPAVATIYLQAAGFDWAILGEVGTGLTIYDQGTILKAYSGTFRASEIAAWHAATCACVVILLLSHRRVTLRDALVAIVIVSVLVSIGILTGRRKFLVMIAIFACTYFGLVSMFIRQAKGPAVAIAIIGGIAYFGMSLGLDVDPSDVRDQTKQYKLYVSRSKGVFGDVPDRVTELGLAPVMWAYDQFGFFGAGLGLGTQGVQHLAGANAGLGAAEGGLGKITLELGIPGLLIVAAFGVALFRHIWQVVSYVSNYSHILTRQVCGLIGILTANAASFSIATQTYGDIFVLLFLGLVLGGILAAPALVAQQLQVNQQAAASAAVRHAAVRG